MDLVLNGTTRAFAALDKDPRLSHLIELLQFRPDRIAVEHNGEIIPRAGWDKAVLRPGDKVEVVQFVGGGSGGTRGPRFQLS
jgi:sulfur carrier protein